MSSIALANCIWSLGIAKQKVALDQHVDGYHELMQLLNQQVINQKDDIDFNPMLKMMLTLSENPNVNKEIIDIFLEIIKAADVENLERQQCMDLLIIFSQIGFADEEYLTLFLGHVLEKHFHPKMKKFMAIFTQSIAKLRYRHEDIMERIGKLFKRTKTKLDFNGDTFVGMARIEADLANKTQQLEHVMRRIARQIFLQQLDQCSIDNCVELLCCVSSTRYTIDSLQKIIQLLSDKLLEKKAVANPMTNDQLSRLRWAQIFCVVLQRQVKWPKKIIVKCEQISKNEAKRKLQTLQNDSFLQEVYQIVHNKYPGAKIGALSPSEEMVVSILVEKGDYKVAVEPRTLENLVINEPYDLLGIKQMELEVLKYEGFRVLFVSQKMWQVQENYQQDILNELDILLSEENVEDQFQQKFSRSYNEVLGSKMKPAVIEKRKQTKKPNYLRPRLGVEQKVSDGVKYNPIVD